MIYNFHLSDYKCQYFAGKVYYDYYCFSKGCAKGVIKKLAHVTYIFPKGFQEELNYCPFTENVLIQYFKEISKLLGFELIALSSYNNYYKLQIRCIPEHRYFLYISTCIRYVYEHPFSELLYCAWQNKSNFLELNIIQIMQFYLALFFRGRYCHCLGWYNNCFSNMNAKSQLNILYDNFNCIKSLIYIESNHSYLSRIFSKFNSKQFPEIVNSINNIANKYYVKYKKHICRW